MIFFMDCEGFGAVEKSFNFDVKLFTMAVLLGSYLLYNSVNSLDEQAVQRLSYLLIYCKYKQSFIYFVFFLHFYNGD